MKYPIYCTYLLLLTIMCTTAKAQNSSKPKLFSSFPDKISCTNAELGKVFSIAANQNAGLRFSDNFSFDGVVTSNVVKYANLQSVVIRSAAYDGAIFVLSKITENGTVNYVGRIINTKYFDGYELKQDAQGNYQFLKIETGRVIQDCSQP
ncbi:hypothetical protein [Ferruginibacter sp.]